MLGLTTYSSPLVSTLPPLIVTVLLLPLMSIGIVRARSVSGEIKGNVEPAIDFPIRVTMASAGAFGHCKVLVQYVRSSEKHFCMNIFRSRRCGELVLAIQAVNGSYIKFSKRYRSRSISDFSLAPNPRAQRPPMPSARPIGLYNAERA